MPVRVLRPSLPDGLVQADNDTRSKKALRSIFGLHSSTSTDISTITASPSPNHITTESRSAQSSKEKEKFSTVEDRNSVDVAGTGSGSNFASLSHRQGKLRDHNGRASVTDVSFFQQTPMPSTLSLKPTNSSVSTPESYQRTTVLTSPSRKSKMTRAQEMPLERATRRKLVRIDAQEGPWSVSVAESPYDRSNYSIYIKTLTHHMTLTRSSQEILALHRKLVSAHPELTLPDLPLRNPDENVESVLADKKRKSSFLHTLSRFATPGPNRRDRPKDVIVAHSTRSSRTSMASGGQPETPISMTTSATLPSKESEAWDPYVSSLTAPDANSALSTALAGYLTSLANEPALKHSKAWRRFVRIRADDLISERIERAVKRVRSDLAAHLSAAKFQAKKAEMRDDASLAESAVLIEPERDQDTKESSHTSGVIENIKEEEEEDVATAENVYVKKVEEIEGAAQDLPGTPRPSDTTRSSLDIPESVSTPTETNATIASRIPRSQSADPDKATRMSRLLQLSSMKNDGDESAAEYESEAQIETEVEEARSTTTADDDSSLSTTDRQRRPKRSKSARLRERATKAKEAKKVAIDDFDMMRVLGKGCAGKVLLVRHRKSENIYALKAITKRHVLAHQELQHTLTEQAVLKRMAREGKDPFVVKLWWSFHDKENLYLVMDFHPGGDLATQLARWGRLGRDRARFYAAEIVEGVDGLHAAGVIYRDLKPENILIGADGHIVLTDFGLSKEFPRRTSPITAPATPSGSRTDFHAQQPLPHWMKGEENKAVWPIGQADSTMTFCGTAEYLAPEVIQGEPYSYEVDWWSFGTMLFEMLTGITPFWADNHADMYCRVLKDELRFPPDKVLDQDTKSLIRGLLQRNPALRIKQPRIKRHPYFSMIDWSHVYYKRYIPPYIPPIDPLNASDTQNFDDTFLGMEPIIDDPLETGEDAGATNEKTNGEDSGANSPEQQKAEAIQMLESRPDLFDGYSFKGRHSVLIEDENEEGEYPEEDEPDEGETDEEEDIQRLANMDVGQEDVGIEPESEAEEPKTPEAKKANLPELTPAEEIAALHRAAIAAAEAAEEASTPVKELSATQPTDVPGKKVDGVAIKDGEPPEGALSLPQTPVTPQAASPAPQAATVVEPKHAAVAVPSRVPPARGGRARREKSGIHALDQYLSDAGDDELTERDEDDDWDFVEALPVGAEDRNGAKGTSLFARGVVDRYRLAVFRKSSTPSKHTQRRNTSGMSFVSDVSTSDAPSPSPSDKQRRGRNAGLTFRRHPKQFLKNRSPPPSAYPNGSSKILTHQSTANTISSAASSNGGILSPASSTQVSMTAGPSLKSKQSTTSVGSPSSDDQSLNGDGPNPASSSDVLSSGQQSPDGTVRTITTDEPDKPKSKKLKKYKEGAEKMLSIFASPR
ncbi:hypothetical protein ACEPAG_226 [Sanghuangporus baumii]